MKLPMPPVGDGGAEAAQENIVAQLLYSTAVANRIIDHQCLILRCGVRGYMGHATDNFLAGWDAAGG